MRVIFSSLKRYSGGKAIFLDRDGVINERIVGGYVCDWRAFRFMPGALQALRLLAELELPIIVVSNQAGVAKGMISRETLYEMTCTFHCAIESAGGRIDGVYYCVHQPLDGCNCRKPKPGLLRQAAAEWALNLETCTMVGDSQTDIEAGSAVRCRSILVGRDEMLVDRIPELKCESAPDLLAAAKLLRISMEMQRSSSGARPLVPVNVAAL